MKLTIASSHHHKFYYLIILLFFVVLWAPLLQMLLRVVPEVSIDENRRLASLPTYKMFSLSRTNFQKAFEAYFTDHFGFRNTLIHLNNYIKTSQLNISPHPTVSIGKNGWYYFDIPLQGVLFKDYMGFFHYDSGKLTHLADNLDMIHTTLSKAGIPFVLVIAPNKQTIYPEYMSNSVVKRRSKTRLDQVLEYLHERKPHLVIVDPRADLIKSKKTLPQAIYYKADTHWTGYGAFVAYQKMMKAMSGLIPVTSAFRLDDYTVTNKKFAGDIAKMLSMENRIPDDEWLFNPKKTVTMNIFDPGYQEPNSPKSIGVDQHKSAMPRLLMYGDSFVNSLIPFLVPHFSHSVFIQSYRINSAHISVEKPDIVLLQIVERNLDDLLEEKNIFIR